ncbi:hypothetical protein AVEN_22632-1 [Araneus ventricosus]|uniref:Uncharacterized protein n=1 Tax=Araneus ventricosus TaxID=182803 RepID=A0A4Y2US21_ARAVE|nr:hypothetical protein AVEN_22632-1 [Araneus ventricosus]
MPQLTNFSSCTADEPKDSSHFQGDPVEQHTLRHPSALLYSFRQACDVNGISSTFQVYLLSNGISRRFHTFVAKLWPSRKVGNQMWLLLIIPISL